MLHVTCTWLLFQPTSGAGTDFEEISDVDFVAIGDEEDEYYPYTSMVGVDELADVAASISSGSVLSIIDWDQVDQLIADVK